MIKIIVQFTTNYKNYNNKKIKKQFEYVSHIPNC